MAVRVPGSCIDRYVWASFLSCFCFAAFASFTPCLTLEVVDVVVVSSLVLTTPQGEYVRIDVDLHEGGGLRARGCQGESEKGVAG